MERVLHRQTLLLYLDDMIVIAHDFETHLQRLKKVYQRLRRAGLKPTKCELLQSQVQYLGHIISSEGVATDPAKVEVVEQWPTRVERWNYKAS